LPSGAQIIATVVSSTNLTAVSNASSFSTDNPLPLPSQVNPENYAIGLNTSSPTTIGSPNPTSQASESLDTNNSVSGNNLFTLVSPRPGINNQGFVSASSVPSVPLITNDVDLKAATVQQATTNLILNVHADPNSNLMSPNSSPLDSGNVKNPLESAAEPVETNTSSVTQTKDGTQTIVAATALAMSQTAIANATTGSQVEISAPAFSISASTTPSASAVFNSISMPVQNTTALMPGLISEVNVASTPGLTSGNSNLPISTQISSSNTLSSGAISPVKIGQVASTLSVESNLSGAPQSTPITSVVAAQGVSSSSIEINILKPTALETTGLIAVVLPQGISSVPSSFVIPMPEQVGTDFGSIKVSLPNQKSLPPWIKYNSASNDFEVKSVPYGGLPLTVLVSVGPQKSLLILSERK